MDKKIKKLKEEYYRKWRHPNGINGIKQNNMNKLDKDYQALLQDILENGVEKNTRNGKVLSVFGRTIRYKFKDGKFPLLTTKKMYFKGIVTELLWFLRGSTNIKFLVDNDCHIWDGDCYQAYLKECERYKKETDEKNIS